MKTIISCFVALALLIVLLALGCSQEESEAISQADTSALEETLVETAPETTATTLAPVSHQTATTQATASVITQPADLYKLTKSDCEKNPATRDACYLNYTWALDDAKFCSKIGNFSEKKKCYLYYAFSSEYDDSLSDMQICDVIEDDNQTSKDYCQAAVAIHNLDKGMCDVVIDNDLLRAQCYAVIDSRI